MPQEEAGEKFIQISKANDALLDEETKENYAKYGNPDGRQTVTGSIGLPEFLMDESKWQVSSAESTIQMNTFHVVLIRLGSLSWSVFCSRDGIAAHSAGLLWPADLRAARHGLALVVEHGAVLGHVQGVLCARNISARPSAAAQRYDADVL